MKGIFFTEKQDIGAEEKPIDMAYNELIKKKYEIRSIMPNSNKPYSKYYLDDDSFEVGGVVKTKKGLTNDGKDGGYFQGRPHSQGGIKAVNVDTNTPIEVEGGEVVITKDAVSDKTKRDFMGKKMTNKEILSYINQSGGGVALAKGGQIMEDGGQINDDDLIQKKLGKLYEQEIESDGRFRNEITLLDAEFKKIIDLLNRKKATIKLNLSVLSRSIDSKEFDEYTKELTQISEVIAKYEMARDLSEYKVLKTFYDSLNETGNAFNVSGNEKPQNPKKIDSPFDKVIYSSNFKLWFGDWEIARETKNDIGVSKAVDENGFPEIYFHGGRQYQTTYRSFDNISVFYWAQDYDYADWFAKNALKAQDTDSVVLRAYIDCKNPIDLTPFGSRAVDLGDLIRYVNAFYPQTNLLKFLPEKYRQLLKKNNSFGITVRAWQLIRQFNPWVKSIRDAGVFDGFMYEENNPSHILNGREHTTKAFAIFKSNQIKFPNQFGFNRFLDDFRFDEGGILI
jgi:hypothetical protein